ncbi:MAG TPA: DegT/DnrJ/EryC1/StrS family aminotransferase [Tepidisphaeraceae bacterium]|jgi:dTDP-4-amino-4,6-dideoxygalactose transaminase|nr:DegT/DnrJ/EryC1/StrS family aminotransferase [Tepidisphaeraceae bacterium]
MEVKLLDLRPQYQTLREEIRRAIDEVCDTQALILGPAVERFETNLAKYCRTKHALGVSSGTDALLCSLMALEIKPGDEVICPSFTFFATAGCIARLGATPIFADIDPATFNISFQSAAERITRKTKAILPVHLFGQCADMTAVSVLARRHGLPIIEDAAQAIGAQHHGKTACSMGLAGALSFYPTKNLGALGDAGAICTNDDEFAERCRRLRVHGSGHTYHHEMIGGMFRLAAIQAAALDVKLAYLDQWHTARQRNAALYDQLLADTPITRPAIQPGNRSVYNQYVIRIPNGMRDAVKQRLADRGIGTAVYYPLPLHRQPCFAYLGAADHHLPETDRACAEVLALPIYPELTEDQIRYVAGELLGALSA